MKPRKMKKDWQRGKKEGIDGEGAAIDREWRSLILAGESVNRIRDGLIIEKYRETRLRLQ